MHAAVFLSSLHTLHIYRWSPSHVKYYSTRAYFHIAAAHFGSKGHSAVRQDTQGQDGPLKEVEGVDVGQQLGSGPLIHVDDCHVDVLG